MFVGIYCYKLVDHCILLKKVYRWNEFSKVDGSKPPKIADDQTSLEIGTCDSMGYVLDLRFVFLRSPSRQKSKDKTQWLVRHVASQCMLFMTTVLANSAHLFRHWFSCVFLVWIFRFFWVFFVVSDSYRWWHSSWRIVVVHQTRINSRRSFYLLVLAWHPFKGSRSGLHLSYLPVYRRRVFDIPLPCPHLPPLPANPSVRVIEWYLAIWKDVEGRSVRRWNAQRMRWVIPEGVRFWKPSSW